MGHYTLTTADRDTHFRIITTSLILSIIVAWLGISVLVEDPMSMNAYASANLDQRAAMPRVLLTAFVLLTLSGAAVVQDDVHFGRVEFVRSCAACHGTDGKGHGPVAKTLKQQPHDLTKLSENNKGVFPIARVFAVIDGRIQAVVHGPREMPVWGDAYTQGLTDRMPHEFMSKEPRDTLVRVRILTLMEYLSTIQGK